MNTVVCQLESEVKGKDIYNFRNNILVVVTLALNILNLFFTYMHISWLIVNTYFGLVAFISMLFPTHV